MSQILTLIHRIARDHHRTHDADRFLSPLILLSLTAEERTRSRHRFEAEDGTVLFFRLPRGTVIQEGDYLEAETGEIIQIIAKAEPVLTVKAESLQQLLRAAYHLGNRHIRLEITTDYLRLLPDPVLEKMLEQLDVTIIAETVPFCPEMGAYHTHH